MWHKLSLIPRSLERYFTYNERFRKYEPRQEKLDLWLPGKKRQVDRVASAVRCLTIWVRTMQQTWSQTQAAVGAWH